LPANAGRRHAAARLLLVLVAFAACAGPRTTTVRHDDGSTSSGAHARGLRDGPWTDFYADGRKQSEGSYAQDVQTGPWTYWFANGKEEMQGSFVDERREGEWTSWYENGSLRARGRFERGFEAGLWRFYDSTGALEHEGSFELGQSELRWTYFLPDGTVRASGLYHAGVKIGTWTTRDAAGEKSEVYYPVPAGLEIIEESFTDSTPKRSGFLREGTPTGLWNTDHPGGKLRLECTFSAGAPNGRAYAWREDGSLLATGMLEGGCIVGEWVFTRGPTHETIDFKVARPRQSFSGEWSPASSADLSGPAAVETWVAELCSPHQPAPIRSVPAETTSTATSSAPTPSVAGIPARAQPWTEYEAGALPALVKLYGAGKSSASEEDWNAPVLQSRASKSLAVAAASSDLIGRALPVKRFTTADGGVIDLDAYVGKKNVLVTILRGFGGQVCVYCTAQTKALAEYSDEFAAHGTEILVVYPGPASGLAAFLDAYQRTFGAGEKLSYKLLYDADLALTRALHIEDNIAVPTSILLDREGIIRWCHVAKDYADRPSARGVLAEIAKLPKTSR
jgi:antitoxin component YwqK of YwqJK toxin-antitoxin module/peroxiredoxin